VAIVGQVITLGSGEPDVGVRVAADDAVAALAALVADVTDPAS